MGKTEYKIVYCGRKSRYSPDSLTIVPLSDCQTPWCYTWLPLDHENHISNLARSANSELPRITSIRHLLFTDATWTPCLCLCSVTPCLLQLSPVWLCPVSLKQTPKSSRKKKKKKRCSLYPEIPKTDQICLPLNSLHWLPTDSWLLYKLSTLRYNCFNSTAPD